VFAIVWLFRRHVFPVVSILAISARASAQMAPSELAELTPESLLEMRVTSVSRETQDVLRTAAAVYVIGQEDIRRSGATDVPELLRTVPGLNVAQINSSTWAISARGFNAQYATKLLVLVDGRSVYDPSSSSVAWHLENLPLEDIDRIEIIRGPGATVWGANAVNGVISITTKRAEHTLGGALRAEFGSGRPGDASVRFGGRIGTNAAYRAFARQTTRSALESPDGQKGGDGWNLLNTGVRVDWDASTRDSLTMQGAVYGGGAGNRQSVLQSIVPLTFGTAGWSSNYGANALGRWTRTLASRSHFAVQAYYDGRRANGYGGKRLDTVDLDLQHSTPLLARHQITWGAGYRTTTDLFHDSPTYTVTPASQTVRLGSAFVQDQVTVIPETLFLTLGTKFETSSLTGANVQPAARAVWQPTERQSFWAASARAVRTANRGDRGLRLVVGGFQTPDGLALMEGLGRADTTSEELTAHELGYRYQPSRRLWFDIAMFYNVYDHLSVIEAGTPFFRDAAPPHLVLPLFFTNNMRGNTQGIEVSSRYQLLDSLAVSANYSHLRMALKGSLDPATADIEEGQSPRNKFYIGATLKLPMGFDVAGNVYSVGRVPSFAVPAYTRIDASASWKLTESLRLRVAASNLLGRHVEHGDRPSPSNALKRAGSLQAVFAF
jgi:iron complex outermembrane recepter protein